MNSNCTYLQPIQAQRQAIGCRHSAGSQRFVIAPARELRMLQKQQGLLKLRCRPCHHGQRATQRIKMRHARHAPVAIEQNVLVALTAQARQLPLICDNGQRLAFIQLWC